MWQAINLVQTLLIVVYSIQKLNDNYELKAGTQVKVDD